MHNMSSEEIRDVAVRCVEGFLNDKVPLSTGLSKEAQAHDMNFEQIKRASEVVNNITHMKLMALSSDRTIEFPLCKVAEVMTSLCVPDSSDLLSDPEDDPLSGDSSVSLEKSASAAESYKGPELTDKEKTLYFIKEASLLSGKLEALEDRAIVVKSQLTKLASSINSDPFWDTKLSAVDKENFGPLSVLISGKASSPKEYADEGLFKKAELRDVKEISELYKEARNIVADLSKNRSLQKQAEELTKALTKQSGVIGSTIGNGIGKTLGFVAGKSAKGVYNTGKFVGSNGLKAATSPVGLGVITDATTYASSGGAGVSRMGASKDVWDALQG